MGICPSSHVSVLHCRMLDVQSLPSRVTLESLARYAKDPGEKKLLYDMSRSENKALFKEHITDGMWFARGATLACRCRAMCVCAG